jgi:hypothetical protein
MEEYENLKVGWHMILDGINVELIKLGGILLNP